MINKEENQFIQDTDKENEPVDIREIIYKYAYYWPLFILFLVVCLSGAFIYLRYSKPVYEVNSTILIKDDRKGGGGSDILNQLDLFGGSKVVENEISILQSKLLMRKVVDRLNLMFTYQFEGRVINSDAYENRPVNIVAIQMDSTLYNQNLHLSFPDQNHYVISDEITGKSAKGELNQIQKNFFGTFKIEKTKDFFTSYKKDLTILLKDPEVVNDQCLSKLSVSLVNKLATVITLSYNETVPQRGKDVLNTLVLVYNEAGLSDKNQTTQSTIKFIDERLRLISGELTDVEKDVEGFKSSHGLTDITSDAGVYLESVKANDIKLNETNLQISVVNDIERYVDSNSSKEKLPSTLGINDPVLLNQINQLGELQLKRDQLLATTQADNPLVEPLKQQIETTREGIKSNVRNIASSLQNTKKQLEGNNSSYQGSIKKLPGQERQYISIKRQQTIKESLYLYLLQKKEEAALSYASAVADSRIVDSAFSSKTPIKPKRSLTYLISMMLGAVLPIVFIYTRDLLNNRITSSSEVTKLTSVPVIGEVIHNEESEAIVVDANSRKAIAEQFRAIRTNLQFVHGKSNDVGRVTLFTSSMSGEGKSFVASNLAAALAISGRKTVLLELDLRKPKVSKYLNLSNKVGLSNYLIGKADIKDIIKESGINENLYIIGSGPVPPNPSELLIQVEMEDLIKNLRDNFDEIIIDSPPVGLVTDAQILSRVADASIYLIRQGITFKYQLRILEKLYRAAKFPKLNIILNGVKNGEGYGYGYGYGYYSDDINRGSSIKLLFKNFLKRF